MLACLSRLSPSTYPFFGSPGSHLSQCTCSPLPRSPPSTLHRASPSAGVFLVLVATSRSSSGTLWLLHASHLSSQREGLSHASPPPSRTRHPRLRTTVLVAVRLRPVALRQAHTTPSYVGTPMSPSTIPSRLLQLAHLPERPLPRLPSSTPLRLLPSSPNQRT